MFRCHKAAPAAAELLARNVLDFMASKEKNADRRENRKNQPSESAAVAFSAETKFRLEGGNFLQFPFNFLTSLSL